MTDREVEYMIDLAKNENLSIGERGRREKRDLELLMKFMYYCHLKMNDALKVSRENITKNNQGCVGVYVYKKEGFDNKYMRFEIPEWFYYELQEHIRLNVKPGRKIIKTKKRALQYAFKQIASEARVEGRLIDVLYAGKKYYTKTKSPQ